MMLRKCWNNGEIELDFEWDRYAKEEVVTARKCWYTDVEDDDNESMLLDSYTIDTVWGEMSYRRYKE
jgi:hypothetical protein